MRLCEAIGITSGDVAAFVGAGGKSSAIRTIASDLVEDGLTVIALPTTKMTAEQAREIGPIVTSDDAAELASGVKTALSSSGAVVAGSARISKDRIGGLDDKAVERLSGLADVVLVEADGSRGLPIKGTAEHEPAIPDSATIAVGVAGIEAFGKPATAEYVHRPEIFSVQTGVGPGHSITARAFARALTDGSLSDLPDNTRPAVLITGVRPGQSMSNAAIIARELWRTGIKKVVLTSLTTEVPPKVWLP